jgi:hypothetical protein
MNRLALKMIVESMHCDTPKNATILINNQDIVNLPRHLVILNVTIDSALFSIVFLQILLFVRGVIDLLCYFEVVLQILFNRIIAYNVFDATIGFLNFILVPMLLHGNAQSSNFFLLFPVTSLRFEAYGVFRFLAQANIAMKSAPARSAKEDGSGTGVIAPPCSPPGMAWMVSIAPLPIVNVP